MKNGKALSIISVCFLIVLFVVVGMTRTARSMAPTDSKYRVFCADNKLEVEQRTLEQEKTARGSNVCQLAEFDYLSDAEKYAENHGGKGSDCKCN